MMLPLLYYRIFTDKPDYTKYTRKNDERIFDVNKAMKPYHKTIDWHKILKGPEMDDIKDMRADHTGSNKNFGINQ